MKYLFLITAACLFLANGKIAIAQSTGNTSGIAPSAPGFSSKGQQMVEAQNLFDQYHTKYRNGGLEGRKILERVQARGLEKTAENVKSIRSVLSSKVTNDEKVVLARILGSLYTHDNKTGMNNAIAGDLRGLTYSGQKDVARTATLAFSRMGYFPDSNEVLLYAQKHSLINSDEYYGELAHIMPFAPAVDQIAIVSNIRNGKSRYAAEILAFLPRNPETMKKLYPETQKMLLSVLKDNEPEFTQAIGEFGFTDAIRYATWLHSVALLSSANSQAKYSEVVLAHLNNEKTDPRKIMAFLAENEGKRLINDMGQRAPFENALQRITLYSKQLPDNIHMKELVQDITSTINSLKG